MKATSGKDFARLLAKHGWQCVRVNGSHHVYRKEGDPARISLPIHGNKPLKLGLMKNSPGSPKMSCKAAQ